MCPADPLYPAAITFSQAPSAIDQLRAMVDRRIAKLSAAGAGMASEDQVAARLAICQTCDQWTGAGCERLGGCSGRARLVVRLASAVDQCERWRVES